MPSVSIVNQPNLYVNNLQLSYTSTTTVTVAAGQCRDSTNIADLILDNAIVLSISYVGLNGLDTGSIAASSWYAVYVIGSSGGQKIVGCVLSLNGSQPTLPSGYDIFRRIGWISTDGSSNILKFYTAGNAHTREYYWDTRQLAHSAAGTTTYTAVDLSNFMPITSTQVNMLVSFNPATAGNFVEFRPTGSSSALNITLIGNVASQAVTAQFSLLTNSAQSLDSMCASTSDNLTLSVLGFTDHI